MCNLSQGIAERSEARGMEKGQEIQAKATVWPSAALARAHSGKINNIQSQPIELLSKELIISWLDGGSVGIFCLYSLCLASPHNTYRDYASIFQILLAMYKIKRYDALTKKIYVAYIIGVAVIYGVPALRGGDIYCGNRESGLPAAEMDSHSKRAGANT